MRQETIRFVDDIDGTDAEQTVTFAIGGKRFEIDLNEKHITALHESFAEWIEHARPIRNSKTTAKTAAKMPAHRDTGRPDKAQLRAIREWASANGFTIAARGRIPAKVVEAYHASV